MSANLPTAEPGRHGWAELLTLVAPSARWRSTLPTATEAWQNPDAYHDYDHQGHH